MTMPLAWDARSVRAWVLHQVTMTIDNHEPWYWAVVNAAAQASGDRAEVGADVTEALRRLIDQEAVGTARTLLYALLDLADREQAEVLGSYYEEIAVETADEA